MMEVDSDKLLEFEVEDLEPGDLEGSSIRWKMALSVNAQPAIVKTNTNDPGGIVIDGNKVLVTINASDNKDIQRRAYYHELRITDAADKSRPVSYGVVNVVDTITSSND